MKLLNRMYGGVTIGIVSFASIALVADPIKLGYIGPAIMAGLIFGLIGGISYHVIMVDRETKRKRGRRK